MDSFGNQIKNTSTEFVLRLYEITKRSVNMSILKLEEGIGLAPTTHGQDLLGSLGTQGAVLAKFAPKGPTQTQTVTEYLVAEYPVTEYSVTEYPVTEYRVTEYPVTEYPVTEYPVTEYSVTESQ